MDNPLRQNFFRAGHAHAGVTHHSLPGVPRSWRTLRFFLLGYCGPLRIAVLAGRNSHPRRILLVHVVTHRCSTQQRKWGLIPCRRCSARRRSFAAWSGSDKIGHLRIRARRVHSKNFAKARRSDAFPARCGEYGIARLPDWVRFRVIRKGLQDLHRINLSTCCREIGKEHILRTSGDPHDSRLNKLPALWPHRNRAPQRANSRHHSGRLFLHTFSTHYRFTIALLFGGQARPSQLTMVIDHGIIKQ